MPPPDIVAKLNDPNFQVPQAPSPVPQTVQNQLGAQTSFAPLWQKIISGAAGRELQEPIGNAPGARPWLSAPGGQEGVIPRLGRQLEQYVLQPAQTQVANLVGGSPVASQAVGYANMHPEDIWNLIKARATGTQAPAQSQAALQQVQDPNAASYWGQQVASLIPSDAPTAIEMAASVPLYMSGAGEAEAVANLGLKGALGRMGLLGAIRGGAASAMNEGNFMPETAKGASYMLLPELMGGAARYGEGRSLTSHELQMRGSARSATGAPIGDLARQGDWLRSKMPFLTQAPSDSAALNHEFMSDAALQKGAESVAKVLPDIDMRVPPPNPKPTRMASQMNAQGQMVKVAVPNINRKLGRVWDGNFELPWVSGSKKVFPSAVDAHTFLEQELEKTKNQRGPVATAHRHAVFIARDSLIDQMNAVTPPKTKVGLGDEYGAVVRPHHLAHAVAGLIREDGPAGLFDPRGLMEKDAWNNRIDKYNAHLRAASGDPNLPEEWQKLLRRGETQRISDKPSGPRTWHKTPSGMRSSLGGAAAGAMIHGPFGAGVGALLGSGVPYFPKDWGFYQPAGFEGMPFAATVMRNFRIHGRPVIYPLVEAYMSNIGKTIDRPPADNAGGAHRELRDRAIKEAVPPGSLSVGEEIDRELRNPRKEAVDIQHQLASGALPVASIAKLLKGVNTTGLAQQTAALSLPQLVDVAEVGDPNEKELLAPIIRQRWQEIGKITNRTQQAKLFQRIQALLTHVVPPPPDLGS